MSEALDNDIINLDDVRRKIEMKKRTDILAAHKYAITHGKDGYWKTYVPDSTKKTGRNYSKRIQKKNLSKLLYYIIKSELIRILNSGNLISKMAKIL